MLLERPPLLKWCSKQFCCNWHVPRARFPLPAPRSSFLVLLGTCRSDDATKAKTSLQKWACVLSFLIAIIPNFSNLGKLYPVNPVFKFGERIKFRRRSFTSSVKSIIRQFHVVVVWRSRCRRVVGSQSLLLYSTKTPFKSEFTFIQS